MSLKVRLSLEETTLNRMSRAQRKRSGDLMTRMKEEFDILREAFESVRQEEREACARQVEDAVINMTTPGAYLPREVQRLLAYAIRKRAGREVAP
jgi:hypothetical protein